jgi:Holliday junction resolvase
MAFSLNFDQKLGQTLSMKKKLKAKGYTSKAGRSVDERSTVDVVGLQNGELALFIEVELKKDNPVENVVKIWRWASKHRWRDTTVPAADASWCEG